MFCVKTGFQPIIHVWGSSIIIIRYKYGVGIFTGMVAPLHGHFLSQGLFYRPESWEKCIFLEYGWDSAKVGALAMPRHRLIAFARVQKCPTASGRSIGPHLAYPTALSGGPKSQEGPPFNPLSPESVVFDRPETLRPLFRPFLICWTTKPCHRPAYWCPIWPGESHFSRFRPLPTGFANLSHTQSTILETLGTSSCIPNLNYNAFFKDISSLEHWKAHRIHILSTGEKVRISARWPWKVSGW